VNDPELAQFTERYVELWNEPDAETRRKTIEALWVRDGSNYTLSAAAVGYDALEKRVTSAYESYVGSGQYRFRCVESPVLHHDAMKVEWEMIDQRDGTIASIGLEFLVLDHGRIVSDHQFIVR
jgi:hypothetical protein